MRKQRSAGIKTERQLSSGGVIFRRRKDRIEVALIATKEGTIWGLPKGLVEPGENIAKTAHREVKEETGLDGRIVKKIDQIEYFYAHKEGRKTTRYFKIVYFFLMEYTGGDVADHDDEVDDCRWFPLETAIETAAYEDEKKILEKAREMLKEGVGSGPDGVPIAPFNAMGR
ncbi:MAG: NUDIX hydrolase [Nitrospirae bacterium]|nr:NUDIX hydrolase [Nitrospirota bacterium]